MKSLIIYDSVFGNTEKIAQSIRTSLESSESIEVVHVDNIQEKQLEGVELLIVGSPTRGFRPTKAIATFLDKLPTSSLKGVKVLAFDTRISTQDVNSRFLNVMVKIFGYAAKPIADKLEKKGGFLLLPPEGFYVQESEGPVKEGELERAAAWGGLTVKC